MLDHDRVGEAGVAAANVIGNPWMAHRHALDVRLVDHCLVIGDPQRSVIGPVEEWIDHHRGHRIWRGVGVVVGVRVPESVGEQCLVPVDLAVDRLGVRVEQQLAGIAPQARCRVVAAVHPVAVTLAGVDPGKVAVPDKTIPLRQGNPGLATRVVEEAELDPIRGLGEDREIGAATVVGRAERVGRARPDIHTPSADQRHCPVNYTQRSPPYWSHRRRGRFCAPGTMDHEVSMRGGGTVD